MREKKGTVKDGQHTPTDRFSVPLVPDSHVTWLYPLPVLQTGHTEACSCVLWF